MHLNDSYVVCKVLRSVLDMRILTFFTHTFGKNLIYFCLVIVANSQDAALKMTEC